LFSQGEHPSISTTEDKKTEGPGGGRSPFLPSFLSRKRGKKKHRVGGKQQVLVHHCTKLAGDLLYIIEHTRGFQVINEPINVFAELAELKTTVDFVKSSIGAFCKKAYQHITHEHSVQIIVDTMTRIRTILVTLKQKFELDFWKETKIQLYQEDFVLKQQADQFVALYKPNGPKKGRDLILCDDGKDFWTKAYADAIFVAWDEWFAKFTEAEPNKDADVPKYEKVIKFFLDFTKDGYVSAFEFGIYLKWFGPFDGSSKRLVKALQGGLLAGFVPALEANLLLQTKVEGTFLIRFSKTQPGSFAVTFVDTHKQIKHCLLYSVEPTGMTLKNPPTVYESLLQFANSHTAKLKYPVGSKFINDMVLELNQTPRDMDDYSTEDDSSYNGHNSDIVAGHGEDAGGEGEVDSAAYGTPDANGTSPLASSVHNSGSNSPSGELVNSQTATTPIVSLTASTTTQTPDGTPPEATVLTQQPTTPVSNSHHHEHNGSSSKHSRSKRRRDMRCVICLSLERDTVFLECGHMACCTECAARCESCPICRQDIVRIINVYHP